LISSVEEPLVVGMISKVKLEAVRVGPTADRFSELLPTNINVSGLHHLIGAQSIQMREGDFSNGEFVPDQMGLNRPFPEASNYRTEIEGLYLCGPSAFPGGGVHAACGYNAYKAIAQDHDLPSPIGSGRAY